jgi:hypothetical protein
MAAGMKEEQLRTKNGYSTPTRSGRCTREEQENCLFGMEGEKEAPAAGINDCAL